VVWLEGANDNRKLLAPFRAIAVPFVRLGKSSNEVSTWSPSVNADIEQLPLSSLSWTFPLFH